MTKVYAWPPVSMIAVSADTEWGVSQSMALFSGRVVTSGFRPARRTVTATPTPVGSASDALGYLDVLKGFIKGGENLVRMDVNSSVWRIAANDQYAPTTLTWTDDGDPVSWTDNGDAVTWYSTSFKLVGTTTTDNSWPALSVTGFPANQVVARPSETVVVIGPSGQVSKTVLKTAKSDADGVAIIRVETAFTEGGTVFIGGPESVLFTVSTEGTIGQTGAEPTAGEWVFREAFPADYASLQEVDPWT